MRAAGVALVTFAYQQHAENCRLDHNGGAAAPRGRCGGCCCRRRRPAPLLKGQRVHIRRFGSVRADISGCTWLILRELLLHVHPVLAHAADFSMGCKTCVCSSLQACCMRAGRQSRAMCSGRQLARRAGAGGWAPSPPSPPHACCSRCPSRCSTDWRRPQRTRAMAGVQPARCVRLA